MRFLIRGGQRSDADALLRVARHLNTLNLPAEQKVIESILGASEDSFAELLPAERREFVFVLEDREEQRIVGSSMIHAQHGTRRSPHVYFDVLEEERYSETLDRYVVHEALRIGYNYNGPSEIGGLILLPEYRRSPERLGKLLSYVRFLFIAMHRSVFRDQIISELLPPLEADGTSRLWEHLGRRFTGLSYQEADLLSKDNKEFIRALFPHGLIYTSLFPEEVREVIGRVGPTQRGVEKMLREIGFEYAMKIDPFDGGPHFIADTDAVTLVQESRELVVAPREQVAGTDRWAVVATEKPSARNFRATTCQARYDSQGDMISIDADVQEILQLERGGRVWAAVP